MPNMKRWTIGIVSFSEVKNDARVRKNRPDEYRVFHPNRRNHADPRPRRHPQRHPAPAPAGDPGPSRTGGGQLGAGGRGAAPVAPPARRRPGYGADRARPAAAGSRGLDRRRAAAARATGVDHTVAATEDSEERAALLAAGCRAVLGRELPEAVLGETLQAFIRRRRREVNEGLRGRSVAAAAWTTSSPTARRCSSSWPRCSASWPPTARC